MSKGLTWVSNIAMVALRTVFGQAGTPNTSARVPRA